MTIIDISLDFSSIFGEGIIIAVVGYVTVFFSLVLLYLAFTFLRRFYTFRVRKKLLRKGVTPEGSKEKFFIEGDVIAAISMAIYLYNKLHDEESNVITIKRTSKEYSPWNSRTFGMRNFNR